MFPPSKPKKPLPHIRDWLEKNPLLKNLAAYQQEQVLLKTAIEKACPDFFTQKGCVEMAYEKGLLLCYFSSPTALSQARFLELSLLEALRQHPQWHGLRKIAFKIKSDR